MLSACLLQGIEAARLHCPKPVVFLKDFEPKTDRSVARKPSEDVQTSMPQALHSFRFPKNKRAKDEETSHRTSQVPQVTGTAFLCQFAIYPPKSWGNQCQLTGVYLSLKETPVCSTRICFDAHWLIPTTYSGYTAAPSNITNSRCTCFPFELGWCCTGPGFTITEW